MAERRSSAGDVAFGILGAGLGLALIVVSALRLRPRVDAQGLPQPQPDGTPPPPPSPTPPTTPAPSPPLVPKGPCSIELSRPWDKKAAPLTILVDGKPATREEAIAVCKAKGGGVRLESKGTLRAGESDEIYNALVDANIKFVEPWSLPWKSEFWKHDASRGVDRIWDPSRGIWRHWRAGPRAQKDASRLTFMMTSPLPSASSSPMRFQQGEGPDMPSYSLKGLITRIKEGGRHDVTLVARAARPASVDYARTYLFKSGIIDVFDELDRKWTLGPDSALVDTLQDPDVSQYQIPADKKVARVAVSGNARGCYGRDTRSWR